MREREIPGRETMPGEPRGQGDPSSAGQAEGGEAPGGGLGRVGWVGLGCGGRDSNGSMSVLQGLLLYLGVQAT